MLKPTYDQKSENFYGSNRLLCVQWLPKDDMLVYTLN